ncbi:MAG: tetratricopeptide repeat protein [Treponema sp.]|nr:tetratricopeptide repeat protein [Treponema sp.]
MKKIFFLFAAIIIFSLSACSSNGFLVPGEKKIILSNIATEYYNIAEGFMEIKNYSKAADYYKLAMRNEDLYLSSYYKLARSYALAKNWESATECYEKLLERDPENTMLKCSLAYITAMSGEVDKAILSYQDLIKANPYDENLLESYVALLINIGRGEDAEESFFLLKEKFPDNKQLTTFAQNLSEIVDNFDADKKTEILPEAEKTDGEKADSNKSEAEKAKAEKK